MKNKNERIKNLDRILTVCVYIGMIVYGVFQYFNGYHSLEKTVNYMGLITLAFILSKKFADFIDKRKKYDNNVKNN